MLKHLLIFPLILLCAELAVFLSTDMVLPALPQMMHEFQVSPSLIQLTLSAWFVGSMSMQLFVGPLSDRYGRRPIFIIGMVLFVLSTLLCAISSHLFMFLIGRFFQGATVCFIMVPGYASIHEMYDQKDAVKLLATMSSISVLAPALGPFIGGIISTWSNWQLIFVLLFGVGTLLLGWVIMRMPETLAAETRQPLHLKNALRIYRSIIGNWNFMHYLLTYSALFCGFMSWLVCGPFLISDAFHYTPFYFGVFQLLVFGFYILANRLVKYLIHRLELKQMIEFGLLVSFSGSVFAITSAFIYPNQIFGFLIGMMMFAFGFGFSSSALQRLTIEASEAPMGSRMAILSLCLGLSGLLSTVLVSIAYHGEIIALAEILMLVSVLTGLLYRSGKQYRHKSAVALSELQP